MGEIICDWVSGFESTVGTIVSLENAGQTCYGD